MSQSFFQVNFCKSYSKNFFSGILYWYLILFKRSINLINKITFTANLLVNPKSEAKSAKIKGRATNISNLFFEKTRYDNYHSLILLEANDNGSDEFILKHNEWEGDTVISRFRTDFTCDLDHMSNDEAAKRLVNVFEVMMLKAEQNKKLQKKIDARDKRDRELQELDTKQKMEFLYQMRKRGLKSDTMTFPELAG